MNTQFFRHIELVDLIAVLLFIAKDDGFIEVIIAEDRAVGSSGIMLTLLQGTGARAQDLRWSPGGLRIRLRRGRSRAGLKAALNNL
jgi:hypothetical protein